MGPRMTIGDFSRATRLSAKTLRFYHEAELLRPAAVDPSNGYRLYETRQVADAQVIRQLRRLEFPIETIRSILLAPDVSTRSRLIAAHLERMQSQLDATRTAVASLESLLQGVSPSSPIELRSIAATPAVVIRQTIDLRDLGTWYRGALSELKACGDASVHPPTGPFGGLWDTRLFLEERGEAALFYPTRATGDTGDRNGRTHIEVLRAVDLAVAVHEGPDETLAQTYGALAVYVAEHEIGLDGPIRETYLREPSDADPDVTTEIGWPIFRMAR